MPTVRIVEIEMVFALSACTTTKNAQMRMGVLKYKSRTPPHGGGGGVEGRKTKWCEEECLGTPPIRWSAPRLGDADPQMVGVDAATGRVVHVAVVDAGAAVDLDDADAKSKWGQNSMSMRHDDLLLAKLPHIIYTKQKISQ